ncbi:MAG: hypothetical protein P8L46_15980 [Acidimicrobiales bacterium]|nr:hypothetical protein [Acidimicrobiales bacterium]MDG2219539.1 hypothetical protein [Acidimicrobiales bacterium]
MAIKVHANTRPIQPSGNLLNVRGFPGAMAALKQYTAVVAEAGKDRRSNLRIEPIGRIDLRDVLVGRGKAADFMV